MSAATDKAQFYIEQLVPELRELEAKQIFTATEIRAIVRQRRDFEHKMNAPGCTVNDAARYLAYEMNLNEMRQLRAKRMGAKSSKHSGPRRIFPLLERMTRKFPGELSIWMQYLDYAKRQKAYKRIKKVFADMLRLHPEKADLWVYAARYEFEEQGDLTEAESYMQRGLRMSPKSKTLFVEFFRLMLDSLAQIEMKTRKIQTRTKAQQTVAGDDITAGLSEEDKVLLPEIDGDDDDEAFDANGEGQKRNDPLVLEALSKTRNSHEQITKAIFDSAMKALRSNGDLALAADMFNIAALYNIPLSPTLLSHIYGYMREQDINDALTRNAALRMPLIGIPVNTADFAENLITVLSELHRFLSEDSISARRLHALSAGWISRYLQTKDIDKGIEAALKAILFQIIESYCRYVRDETSPVWLKFVGSPHQETVELLGWGDDAGGHSSVLSLREAASSRWPTRIQSLELVKTS